MPKHISVSASFSLLALSLGASVVRAETLPSKLPPHLSGAPSDKSAEANKLAPVELTRLAGSPASVLACATPPPFFTDVTILKQGNETTPTTYVATKAQVLGAMVYAANVMHVNLNMAGSIGYLESDNGLSNSVRGYNEGLFQMSPRTSGDVAHLYGAKIADALKATCNVRYASAIPSLEQNHLPNQREYQNLILDPYFGALIGMEDLTMEAADHGLSAQNAKNIVLVDSIHTLGKMIRPLDVPLLSLVRAYFVRSNAKLLGVTPKHPFVTQAEAYQSIRGKIAHFLAVFIKDLAGTAEVTPKPLGPKKPHRPLLSLHIKYAERSKKLKSSL